MLNAFQITDENSSLPANVQDGSEDENENDEDDDDIRIAPYPLPITRYELLNFPAR
jgi:hypothetical protein